MMQSGGAVGDACGEIARSLLSADEPTAEDARRIVRSVCARRALEQQLIQRWWPPFNKETRRRWATPFTAEL